MITPPDVLLGRHWPDRAQGLPPVEVGAAARSTEALAQLAAALAPFLPDAALAVLAPLLALPVAGDGLPVTLDAQGLVLNNGGDEPRLRALLWVALAAQVTPGVPQATRDALAAVAARRTETAPVRVTAAATWDAFNYDDGTRYDAGGRDQFLLRETALAGLVLLAHGSGREALRAAEFAARYFRPASGSGPWATCVQGHRAAFARDAEGYALAALLFARLNTHPHPEELLGSLDTLASQDLYGDADVMGFPGVTGTVCPRATALAARATLALAEPGRPRGVLRGLRALIDPRWRSVRGPVGTDVVATALLHAAPHPAFLGGVHA